MSAGKSDALRVEVLGPLRVWRHGRELALGPPKQRAAFSMLALSANRAVSRGELINGIWGEEPPESAGNSVHVYVGGLRRILDPSRGPRAPSRLLASTGSGYLLRLEPGQLDAHLLHHYLQRARQLRAGGDLTGAAKLFDASLGLWRGAILGEIPGPFADIERTRLTEVLLTVVEERAEVMIATGRQADVAAELSARVRDHPLRERLRALLMLALYESGRQAEALATFRDGRQVLVDELAIEPGPELQRLHQRILTGNGAISPPNETGTSAAVLGEDAARLPLAQLPHDIHDFVGRSAELDRLTALLRRGGRADLSPSALVITEINGAAGVGKTALAVHFAHQVRSRFQDGQLFVDLRGFSHQGSPVPAVDALGHLLWALGVDPRLIPADLDGRTAMYRTVLSAKRVLVLLDNAASADQVRPLLPGTPNCLVIVTSRSRLDGLMARDGADRMTLKGLAPLDAVELLTRSIRPSRAAAERQALEEIARLCGYLPLALRITAERIATHPHVALSELAHDLAAEGDRLDLLAVAAADGSLRAALRWSYHALPPAAAHTFRLLGTHPGADISTPAAAALLGTGDAEARRRLDALARVHLIEETGRDRWRFHDLTRLYAAERAIADEPERKRARAGRRLRQWYLHTADRADSLLDPRRPRMPLGLPDHGLPPLTFADPGQALRWCDAERANLVAVTEQAARCGDPDTAWQLPVALFGYFYLRKPWNDWIRADDIGLAAARRAGDRIGQAAIQTSLGIALHDLLRFGDAIGHLEDALAAWREIGHRGGEAIVLDTLGAAHRDLHGCDDAIDRLQQALVIWREIGDSWGQAVTLHNLGDANRELGRYDAAIEHLEQSMAIRREIGDHYGIAWTLHDLGRTYHDLARYTQAAEYLRQAASARRRIADRWGEARTLLALGESVLAGGRIEQAREAWRAALRIFEDLADPRGTQLRERLERLCRSRVP